MMKLSNISWRIRAIVLLYIVVLQTLQSQQTPTLSISEKTEVHGNRAREPMFVEHPSGTLFVSGYNNKAATPQLWRSDDQGKTWQMVNVGTQREGADGNSDVDLAVDEAGNLYLVAMRYTTFPEDMAEFDVAKAKGQHIAIGASSDKGITWSWTYLSKADYDDRPWVKVASDQTVHVIWNNDKGVHHAVSDDMGKTWQRKKYIYSQGGSSHFSMGKDGLMAVRVSALAASGRIYTPETDLIRVSKNNGITWESVELPGHRSWKVDGANDVDRWVDPLAWDATNILYHMWAEENILFLAASNDNGHQWKIMEIVQSDTEVYYPYMSISGDYLVCSWLSGYDNDLRHNVGCIDLRNNDFKIKRLEPLKLNNLKGRFAKDSGLSNGGEYFPIKILKNGDIAMVTTIQDYENNKFGFTWWTIKRK